jgi:O-antigen ligase
MNIISILPTVFMIAVYLVMVLLYKHSKKVRVASDGITDVLLITWPIALIVLIISSYKNWGIIQAVCMLYLIVGGIFRKVDNQFFWNTLIRNYIRKKLRK